MSSFLQDLELYTKVQFGNSSLEDLTTCRPNGKPGAGLATSVLRVVGTKSKLSDLEKASYRQWLEYVSIYKPLCDDVSNAQPVLKELNEVLISKSYFVNNQPSIIDAVFYYLLYRVMSSLSFQNKEKYLHLSRWFNTVQHDIQIRQSKNLVIFSRTPLYLKFWWY